jgi:hypothetical protein
MQLALSHYAFATLIQWMLGAVRGRRQPMYPARLTTIRRTDIGALRMSFMAPALTFTHALIRRGR